MTTLTTLPEGNPLVGETRTVTIVRGFARRVSGVGGPEVPAIASAGAQVPDIAGIVWSVIPATGLTLTPGTGNTATLTAVEAGEYTVTASFSTLPYVLSTALTVDAFNDSLTLVIS